MYRFGKRSKNRLKGVKPELINILNELIKIMDVTIIEGARSEEKQKEYFAKGKSKIDGVTKKGMHQLGKAVDLAPYPINWKDSNKFYYMGGMIRGIAKQLNLKVRWGGDWDSDGNIRDQKFMDLVHIEIRE